MSSRSISPRSSSAPQRLSRPVGGTVVNDDDFLVHGNRSHAQEQPLDRGHLVERRDHHRDRHCIGVASRTPRPGSLPGADRDVQPLPRVDAAAGKVVGRLEPGHRDPVGRERCSTESRRNGPCTARPTPWTSLWNWRSPLPSGSRPSAQAWPRPTHRPRAGPRSGRSPWCKPQCGSGGGRRSWVACRGTGSLQLQENSLDPSAARGRVAPPQVHRHTRRVDGPPL